MFTMPRLISAVLLAVLAWIVTGQIKVEVLKEYESYNFGWFVPLSVTIGFLCGWTILGSRATGRMGFGTAPSIGFTAAAAMVFWVLFLVTSNEMLRLALARRYTDPVDAIYAMVPLGGSFGRHILHSHIILTIVIGGCIAGWVADWSARRWK